MSGQDRVAEGGSLTGVPVRLRDLPSKVTGLKGHLLCKGVGGRSQAHGNQSLDRVPVGLLQGVAFSEARTPSLFE